MRIFRPEVRNLNLDNLKISSPLPPKKYIFSVLVPFTENVANIVHAVSKTTRNSRSAKLIRTSVFNGISKLTTYWGYNHHIVVVLRANWVLDNGKKKKKTLSWFFERIAYTLFQ